MQLVQNLCHLVQENERNKKLMIRLHEEAGSRIPDLPLVHGDPCFLELVLDTAPHILSGGEDNI